MPKCQHPNKHIVVVEAFDIYEKTETRCTTCGAKTETLKHKNTMKLLTPKTAIVLIMAIAIAATFIPKAKVIAIGIMVSIQLVCNHKSTI